jgi:hypothetical protein
VGGFVGFVLGHRFLNPWGLAYGFIWHTRHQNTKMLLKVVFDKTAFVKFKI